MKKLFALLLAVLMVLSLAGCAGKGGETPAEEPTNEPAAETFDELLAAGIANGKKLTVYTTHSVAVSALEAFMGAYAPGIEYDGQQIGTAVYLLGIEMLN